MRILRTTLGKHMKNAIQAILVAANNAYENGECHIHCSKEELGDVRGDTLADFLHIELQEVCEGHLESEMPEIAANAVANAIKQLEAVEAVEAALIQLSK